MPGTLTTDQIAIGTFRVLWNGAETGYEIVNGSLGLSGRDTRNVYGIVKPNGSHIWVGSLASCKKLLAHSLAKKER